jgi:Tfp pilus assembly protein PilX
MRNERGIALIIALVTLVILTILGISGVNQATRELRELVPFTDQNRLLECAISSINYVSARLQAVAPTSVSLSDTTITENPNLIIKTAHYGQESPSEISYIGEVRSGDVEGSKATSALAIVTNWIGNIGGGASGTPYSMVVLCRDNNGNEQEINFVFRFLSMF